MKILSETGRFLTGPVLVLCLILTLPALGVTGEQEGRAGASQDASRDASQKAMPPLRITVQQALLMAIENNRSLKIERLNPQISRTFEEDARAAFDPTISAGAQVAREEGLLSQTSTSSFRSSDDELLVSGSQFFPTGTEIGLDFSADRLWSDFTDDRYSSRLGLSVTQALLQGRGLEVNLATLRQARLDSNISRYELRGFAETLVATVEETYWEYVLAGNQIRIFEDSLKLAVQQMKETEEIIQVGRLAETEIVAAQAEIALRRQDLIDAQSVLASTRLSLLRLLNVPEPGLWNRELVALDEPVVPEIQLDGVESHVKVALRLRSELKEAELEIQRGELQIVKTKNGLLPKLDLFISLGKTGYADSFGGSVGNMTGNGYDFLAGLQFEFPIHNRAARADYQRATLSDQKARESLDNLSQLVELDVRTAFIELNRARQQISASRATLKLEQEQVRIENEKLKVGKSTSFLVAQAQRDLLRSQIQEVNAVINYLQGLVRLYRQEGSILERWGIRIDGEVQ